jgi:uncharacterized tellurite resistance protein B-like protein
MLSAQIRQPAPSLRSVAPQLDIPEAVEAVIARTLEKAPEARFEDMHAFREALAAIPAGEAPPATTPAPGQHLESTAGQAAGSAAAPEQPDAAELESERTAPRAGGMPPVPSARKRPPRPRARAAPSPHASAPGPASRPPASRVQATMAMSAPPVIEGPAEVPVPAYLPHLAYCFVALYRSVEGFLTNEHCRALAGRLERWAAGAPAHQLIPIVRRCISEYDTLPDRPARIQRLREHNHAIAAAMPRDRLAHVLADLYEIASDDGRVREPELRFIVTATAQLGLTPDPKLLAIAYLYLTLAYADGTLDQSEKEVTRKQLRRWAPKASVAELKAVIRWAVAEFKRRPTKEERLGCALEATDQLRETVGPETQQEVLADLWRLAGADGHVSPEEREMIMAIVDRFGGDTERPY